MHNIIDYRRTILKVYSHATGSVGCTHAGWSAELNSNTGVLTGSQKHDYMMIFSRFSIYHVDHL